MTRISQVDYDEAWAYLEAKAADPSYRRAVVSLFKRFQFDSAIGVDGKVGPISARRMLENFSLWHGDCCFPLPIWNGVKPEPSSGHADSNKSRPTHRGTDIMYKIGGRWKVPADVPLLNVADGVVIHREERSNGWAVAVEHINGEITLNRHLAEPLVEIRQRVRARDRIALFDQDQNPPHCHFEWYAFNRFQYSRSLDPENGLLGRLPMVELD